MNLKLNAALEAATSTATSTTRKQCEKLLDLLCSPSSLALALTADGSGSGSGFGSGAAHEVTQTCIKMPVLLCRLACVEVSLYCSPSCTLSPYLLHPRFPLSLSLSLFMCGCATASVLRASAPPVCCETQTASETPLKPTLPCLPCPLPPCLPAVAHNLLQFAASTFLSIFVGCVRIFFAYFLFDGAGNLAAFGMSLCMKWVRGGEGGGEGK